ncbi:MAG: hypothetical protein N3E47_01525 [Candidatus Bathyarchaeota archaeon]|nr:hypothetical protein [Candidatus Bathyarchaeota archaeon]
MEDQHEYIKYVVEAFNQAWVDLCCPPVRLIVDNGKPKDSGTFIALNGRIRVNPGIIPKGCDPYKYLLWFFRHELTHVHYCPYDARTAYSLEKAAYSVTGDWDFAYLVMHLFADLQININYLPRRFDEIPYFMRIIKNASSLLELLLQEVYLQVNPIRKPSNKALENVSKELLAITLLNKPWHTKVQMMAIALSRLKSIFPGLFSKRRVEKGLRDNVILVREDLLPNSLRSFEEIFGEIERLSDAEKFFKQWIEPRLPPEEREKAERMVKKVLVAHKKGPGKTEEGRRGYGDGEGGKSAVVKSLKKPDYGSNLEEPFLPSSLSKPYEKISSKIFDNAFWKRFWYRSRAENIIMHYLSESRVRKPVWAVVKYPDDWYIEDDIEDLDLDISLDEGPLIPEITTLKWVEEPTFHGQSLITGYVPSEITILDSSLSMSKIHDEAAIAAFIAYLAAHKAGGQTSAVTFSTNYVSAGWDSPSELKELVLSMAFDEYTIFPIYEVRRLISENAGSCFIVIITDCGWQNIEEALPVIEDISNLGHKVVIFLLPGGDYPEKINMLRRCPNVKIYNIRKPEEDLKNLVLLESVKTYKTFLS